MIDWAQPWCFGACSAGMVCTCTCGAGVPLLPKQHCIYNNPIGSTRTRTHLHELGHLGVSPVHGLRVGKDQLHLLHELLQPRGRVARRGHADLGIPRPRQRVLVVHVRPRRRARVGVLQLHFVPKAPLVRPQLRRDGLALCARAENGRFVSLAIPMRSMRLIDPPVLPPVLHATRRDVPWSAVRISRFLS